MTDTELNQFLRMATSPPAMEGTKEVGGLVAKYSEVAAAVVPKLRIAGLSLFEIVKAIGLIGYFLAQHGDDIDAIVAAILALFKKTPPPAMRGAADVELPKVGE